MRRPKEKWKKSSLFDGDLKYCSLSGDWDRPLYIYIYVLYIYIYTISTLSCMYFTDDVNQQPERRLLCSILFVPKKIGLCHPQAIVHGCGQAFQLHIYKTAHQTSVYLQNLRSSTRGQCRNWTTKMSFVVNEKCRTWLR